MRFAPAVSLALLACFTTHPAQAVPLELDSPVVRDATTVTATVTSEPAPTAAFEHSPTRTPVASRTPTPSPTRVFTYPPPRTPLPRGFPCEDASYCTSHFCIDLTCCDKATCPTDQFCNISAHAGSCASLRIPAIVITRSGGRDQSFRRT